MACLVSEIIQKVRVFLILIEHTIPLTRLLIPMHVNTLYHTCTYSRLPEDKALGSKHVEDIINLKNSNINFANVYYVGLYCIFLYTFGGTCPYTQEC